MLTNQQEYNEDSSELSSRILNFLKSRDCKEDVASEFVEEQRFSNSIKTITKEYRLDQVQPRIIMDERTGLYSQFQPQTLRIQTGSSEDLKEQSSMIIPSFFYYPEESIYKLRGNIEKLITESISDFFDQDLETNKQEFTTKQLTKLSSALDLLFKKTPTFYQQQSSNFLKVDDFDSRLDSFFDLVSQNIAHHYIGFKKIKELKQQLIGIDTNAQEISEQITIENLNKKISILTSQIASQASSSSELEKLIKEIEDLNKNFSSEMDSFQSELLEQEKRESLLVREEKQSDKSGKPQKSYKPESVLEVFQLYEELSRKMRQLKGVLDASLAPYLEGYPVTDQAQNSGEEQIKELYQRISQLEQNAERKIYIKDKAIQTDENQQSVIDVITPRDQSQHQQSSVGKQDCIKSQVVVISVLPKTVSLLDNNQLPKIITENEPDDKVTKILESIKEYESKNGKKIFAETANDRKGKVGIAFFDFSFTKPRPYIFKFKNKDLRGEFIEILKKYDPSSQADSSSDLKKITNFLLSGYPADFLSTNYSPTDSDIDDLKKLLRKSENFKNDFDTLREIKEQTSIDRLAERLYEIIQEKQSQAQQPSTTLGLRRQSSAVTLGSNLAVDAKDLRQSQSPVALNMRPSGPLPRGSADAVSRPLQKETRSSR